MSTAPTSARTNIIAGAAAIIVMALAFLVFSGTSGDVTTDTASQVSAAESTADTDLIDEQSADAEATPTTIADTMVDTVARASDLPTITLDELPIEAIETLLLIDDGGPYPYRQDDGTFQNREGILPDRSREHYREYTVDTPGSSTRGARRIVSGADGERYYTDDHYESFREISR